MSNINFPIFDQLETISSSYDKKLYSNNLLSKKMSLLDHNDKETIYLIIKLYTLKYEKKSPLSIPYDGNVLNSSESGSTIEFDLENFPEQLVKLLNIFIKEIIKKN